MHRTLLAAGFMSPALALPARALDCIVADPTGTPLNIRMSPNGKTVATAQGTRIQVFEGQEKYGNQNRPWYYVAACRISAAPDGYAPGGVYPLSVVRAAPVMGADDRVRASAPRSIAAGDRDRFSFVRSCSAGYDSGGRTIG